jgi:hypothetical protein
MPFHGRRVWAASPQFIVYGGVLDPNFKADNLADHAFDTVNFYITSILSYTVGGPPGQFSPALNWSNKPKLNLELPFGPLTTSAATSQAVGALIGAFPNDGLPADFRDHSWATIANRNISMSWTTPQRMARSSGVANRSAGSGFLAGLDMPHKLPIQLPATQASRYSRMACST